MSLEGFTNPSLILYFRKAPEPYPGVAMIGPLGDFVSAGPWDLPELATLAARPQHEGRALLHHRCETVRRAVWSALVWHDTRGLHAFVAEGRCSPCTILEAAGRIFPHVQPPISVDLHAQELLDAASRLPR